MLMHVIERAYKAHKSVQLQLKRSPLLLRKPDFQIVRRLTRRPTALNREKVDKYSASAGKHVYQFIPQVDDMELSLRVRWSSGGDHELLMSMIHQGRLPVAWSDAGSPDHPPSLSNAMARARDLGYTVPQYFSQNASSTSYSEAEAFHAAHMIARGHFTFFEGDRRPADLVKMRQALCQLTGQFLVPDPLSNEKTPYFLDQLWIFAFPDRSIRLIAIEIDGEIHLSAAETEKTRKRDAMLAAQGYEVYHIAGWWCRIDPFRAVLAALAAAGLLEDAHHTIIGSRFNSISDYRCDYCRRPMVRWDIDWIQEICSRGECSTVHRCCIEKAGWERHQELI